MAMPSARKFAPRGSRNQVSTLPGTWAVVSQGLSVSFGWAGIRTLGLADLVSPKLAKAYQQSNGRHLTTRQNSLKLRVCYNKTLQWLPSSNTPRAATGLPLSAIQAGRQHRRTTRETDRKRALAVAEQYERVAKSKGNPQRVRQILSEFLRDHYDQELPFSSVSDFTEQWLAARKSETSPGTHRRYGDAVAKFLAFLGAAADRGLDTITRTQISAFRDTQLAKSAPATSQPLPEDPQDDLPFSTSGWLPPSRSRRKGQDRQEPRYRWSGVHSRSMNCTRSLRLPITNGRALIKFGLYTGQRLGDLACLTWSQIYLDRDEIRLTTRKTGKQLLIPIAVPLREHLLTIATGDNPRAPVHPSAFEIIARSEWKSRNALQPVQRAACRLRIAWTPASPQ